MFSGGQFWSVVVTFRLVATGGNWWPLISQDAIYEIFIVHSRQLNYRAKTRECSDASHTLPSS